VSQRLQGKRAIVTGGGSGIGRAAALKLGEEGAKVAVLDVDFEAAQRVADAIIEADGNAMALAASVADESQVADAVSQAEARFGGLDTLIANAGILLFGRDTVATELDLETWQQCLDVNLTGMFLTCKHGLRALQRSGSGSVVITSSPTGSRAPAQ
jgi:NAD(P)-dependent dehydrogenase (short-subunit alcohol dehydrogenase family)